MSSVKLDRISRKFTSTTAQPEQRFIGIDDISFEIPDGEFWVLVGPSGCGKSTLLRIIAGLETATSGSVYIGDRLVNKVPARQRDVAMVFQNYALYPHMTVAENLGFGMQMRGTDRSIISRRIQEIAKLLKIDTLLDRKPKQLSGGQQQRVALGRAIARSPQVFLLDEPLSNLDTGLRDDTRAELKQLHQQVGITTIYVTHDCVEAMTLADRIVVLDRGYIKQIGTPTEIYHRPIDRMVATFMGTPPMNIFPASYHDGYWQIGERQISCDPDIIDRLRLRDRQGFNLGIRPEYLSIVPDDTPNSLLATLESIETLGRETLLKVQIVGTSTQINLLVSPYWSQQIGEPRAVERLGNQLTIQIATEWLFVFDPTSGQRLFPLN
ncbi:ABC transporter ATP-binding protein [Chamaesiphon minutus]|uniref:ATPase component of ABC-type sugar transporter n=1 Tax=Chamaesiphon minutus (strain ATCC 27169 / PCC 6605) TaxID=1173020 RepID=K9UKI9_CHAP6|nr:ABC transporter ATP-binding protein [Chamaesiphon minutus]AFY95315.1 ATPase component of ABC-type sugar transporter [Chamaesiphon minutus PCC 6605]